MRSVSREEARLKRIFRRLVLLSVAAPAAGAYACSTSNAVSPSQDGGADATSGVDAGHGDGAAAVPDGGSPADGGTAVSCEASAPYFNDASFVSTDGGTRTCYYFVDLACGMSYPRSDCYLYLRDCANLCTLDAGFTDCRMAEGRGCADGGDVYDGGPTTIACGLCSGVGRRPEGLLPARFVRGASAVGSYFAEAAHLEAASVAAFRVLQGELAVFGAPRTLIRSAAIAAEDEVRHARTTRRLARRFGGAAVRPRVTRTAPRSLEAMARENAVEGCVGETFGAMVASWQGEHARDARIARAMRRIAGDETRHAALAWSIAGWAEEKLSARARARLRAEVKRAVAKLLTAARVEPSPELVREAGVPTAAQARALLQQLETALWTSAR